jgi:hypothetical protein
MGAMSLLVAAVAMTAWSGAASADPWKDESGHGRGFERYERDYREGRDDRYQRDYRYTRDNYRRYYRSRVPAGHLPPPGTCRIWFPDRPPGHQPPPGPCWELSRFVPRGARLIPG